MTVNQKIAVAAIAALVLCAFLSPIVAYDHKIDDCIKTYKKNTGGDDATLRIYCTRIVNGSLAN